MHDGMGADHRLTLLVVEDDADIRETLAEALEGEGYLVFTARHGREALDRLEFGLRPALILLDLMMPVMNGLEFLSELRTRPGFSRTPVVVVSANQGYEAEDLGAREVLRKPITLDTLFKVVSRLVAPEPQLSAV